MKRFVLFLLSGIFLSTVSAFATVSSDYLQDLYSCRYDTQVRFKSKKEFVDKYEQKFGDIFISSIAYGYADLKIKGRKKIKVSYICLLGNDLKPVWGYVIPR